MEESGIKRIWAPWRMRYIDGTHKDEGCIFCNKIKQDTDRDNLILHRGENAYIIMNLFPYTNGHVMVVPHKHTGNLEDLEDSHLLEMMKLAQFCIKAMKACMGPAGFNAGFNIGRPAGAGIVDHVHLHIVPRWVGDTNFMPLISETKVISEHIYGTYDKIRGTMEKLGGI